MPTPEGTFETPTMKTVREGADPQLIIKNLRTELAQIKSTLTSRNIPELADWKSPGELAGAAILVILRLRAEHEADEKGKEESHREIQELKRRLALAERGWKEAEKELTELAPLRSPLSVQMPSEVTGLPQEFVSLATAALCRFAEGYAEYGPGAADALGLAGQWGDLHRKVAKLKRSMWEGEPAHLTRESEADILNDIIGHCLLALDMLGREMEGGR